MWQDNAEKMAAAIRKRKATQARNKRLRERARGEKPSTSATPPSPSPSPVVDDAGWLEEYNDFRTRAQRRAEACQNQIVQLKKELDSIFKLFPDLEEEMERFEEDPEGAEDAFGAPARQS